METKYVCNDMSNQVWSGLVAGSKKHLHLLFQVRLDRRSDFERVKVPACTRVEFLALGVWIGGPRLVSRSPVPPLPNGTATSVDRVARTTLAAPKTLGCARRSLRGSRAFRSSRRLFRPGQRRDTLRSTLASESSPSDSLCKVKYLQYRSQRR